MKACGWALLIGGFTWIVFVATLNPTIARIGWSDEMAHYTQRDSYTRDEVFDAMRRVAKFIRSKQLSPLWGGLAMLFGATLTTVSKGKAPG